LDPSPDELKINDGKTSYNNINSYSTWIYHYYIFTNQIKNESRQSCNSKTAF